MEFDPSRGDDEHVKMEAHSSPSPKKRLKVSYSSMAAHISPSFDNLSDDVIDHIISFLPIKEAGTTSLLSKRFETSWKHSKHLNFNFWFSKETFPSKLAEIINRVVTLHSGKEIKSFQLCLNSDGIESSILSWIELALAKGPSLIELDFIYGRYNVGPLEIPFDVLDIESIRILRLSYCLLHLPPKFKGLQFLHTLELKHITLSPSFIKIIMDNCLLLETLDLVRCYNVRRLLINAVSLKFFTELRIGDCHHLDYVYVNAPTLRVFHFVGKPQHISFNGRMPELKDVMLLFKLVSYVLPRLKMSEFVLSIADVTVLTVTSTLLEDLCSTFLHGRLMGPKQYFWHLTELQLQMEHTSFCNVYDVVCFVERCPKLERLFIDLQKFTFDEKSLHWEMHYKARFERFEKQFPFLKVIKISCFKFKSFDTKLVKFFLERATHLETLAIFTVKNYRLKKNFIFISDYLQHLVSWRSSPKTRVGVYEYYDMEDDRIVPAHQDIWYDPL